MKGYIYRIENKINGNNYIGKTYLPIEERWKQHKKEVNKERAKDRPLYRAINKYGIENFQIIEIEFCENLEEREKYWIQKFDTYKNGYNATLGGDGKTYFEFSDEEVIQKYQEYLSVNETAKFFECNKDTISIRLHNNGINIPVGGNIYNEKRNWQAKKVEQYSLTGEFIQEFYCLQEAAKWLIENNYTQSKIQHIVTNISRCARGIDNRKKAYKFIWKFPEQYGE